MQFSRRVYRYKFSENVESQCSCVHSVNEKEKNKLTHFNYRNEAFG